MSTRSSGDGADTAAVLANELFTQLTALMEEVSNASMNVIASEDTDLRNLANRRSVVIQQLLEILKNTPLTDPLLQPVKSQISVPHFLDELSRERRELKTALRNVESNKEQLSTLLDNAHQRDENLLSIVEGIKKETDAIEDEDPNEELRKLEKMKKRMMRAFNTILDRAYPEVKRDVKTIIEELVSWDSEDPYMPIPADVLAPAVLLLSRAGIIEMHDDHEKIRLLVPN